MASDSRSVLDFHLGPGFRQEFPKGSTVPVSLFRISKQAKVVQTIVRISTNPFLYSNANDSSALLPK
jgi:hypothetical protein